MKASQITIGSHYKARVSGKIVTVRVDGIREVSKYKWNNYSGQSETRQVTVYDVTNLSTGRKLVFQSAAKFRSAYNPLQKAKTLEFIDRIAALRNVRELHTQY